jgi:hypothetical protein
MENQKLLSEVAKLAPEARTTLGSIITTFEIYMIEVERLEDIVEGFETLSINQQKEIDSLQGQINISSELMLSIKTLLDELYNTDTLSDYFKDKIRALL